MVTEVVAKISRNRLIQEFITFELLQTILLCLIEAIAPGNKTKNNKILQPLV